MDTSDLNVHQLRATIENAFAREGQTPPLTATVMSFGFKYGVPLDADLVVDARFLPNPHWIPELRPFTGRDPGVRDYVLGQEDAAEFLDRYTEVLRLLVPGYRREGKRYLTLAVGCTGGKHRSVAIAEEFARRLTGRRHRRGGPAPRPGPRVVGAAPGRAPGRPAWSRSAAATAWRAAAGRVAAAHARRHGRGHRRRRRRLLRPDPPRAAGAAAGGPADGADRPRRRRGSGSRTWPRSCSTGSAAAAGWPATRWATCS